MKRAPEMQPLGDLLASLATSLPIGAGDPAVDGVAVAVTELHLAVPVETRIGGGGELRAQLPRGRMATGFQLPHGHIVARFDVDRGGRP